MHLTLGFHTCVHKIAYMLKQFAFKIGVGVHGKNQGTLTMRPSFVTWATGGKFTGGEDPSWDKAEMKIICINKTCVFGKPSRAHIRNGSLQPEWSKVRFVLIVLRYMMYISISTYKISIYIYINTHTYTHTHMHTYIHTYMHTYIHVSYTFFDIYI